MAVTAGAEGEVSLTPEQVALTKLVKADTDGNGTCNTADVQKILRTAIGIEADSEVTDIDSSGYTSTQDALVLLKHLSGVEPLVTDAELLDIVNAKLNAVKTEKPGFTGVSTARCTSMKVTQKFTSDNFLINAILADMNYTDLEYDKYIDKMVAQLESSKSSIQSDNKLTQAQKDAEIADINQQIASMEKSKQAYKEEETITKTVSRGNATGHTRYFPLGDNETVSSKLTKSDINKITYSISNGEITLNIVMNSTSYNNSTYPKTQKDLMTIPYGKAFNVPYLRSNESGSSITTAKYENGKITVSLDKDTQAIKKAVYSYSYFSDIKAPQKSMSQDGVSVTVDMSTKMSVNINETFTF